MLQMLTREQIEDFYKQVEGLGLRFPVADIAKKTGEPKGNVSKYLSRKMEPSKSFIERFYKGFDLSYKKVSRESETTDKEPYHKQRLAIKNGDKESDIPMYFGNTRAGTIEVYSDDPDVNKPVGHLPASIFPSCNHAEKVSGDSMYPLICNQAYVIGRVVDKKGIIYGEKYIIHTKYGQNVVKYIHPSDKGQDHIKIVSHNKQVPSQDLPLDDITFVCRVHYIVNPS
jgi:phage repressor protein C with HTH and peptisase S24 domain